MSTISVIRAKTLVRVAAPILLAATLGACSSIPDWADPTGWLGSDSQPSTDQSSNAAQTPDLADIPPKPTPPSTPDEQKQVTDSLAADRAQAQYSAEALQGGTEPPAAAPRAEEPSPAPDTSAAAAPAAADQTASSDATSGTSESAPSATASVTPDARSQPAADTVSAPPATQTASAEPAASAAPVPPAAESSAQPTTGFAPSHAPPLDPSVAQYVPRAILSRYQQTAAQAAAPGIEGMPAESPAPSRHHRKGRAAPAASDPTAAPAP